MKRAFAFCIAACLISPIAAAPVSAFQKPAQTAVAADANIGSTVPEPAGYALLGLGIGLYIGAVQMRRRRSEERKND